MKELLEQELVQLERLRNYLERCYASFELLIRSADKGGQTDTRAQVAKRRIVSLLVLALAVISAGAFIYLSWVTIAYDIQNGPKLGKEALAGKRSWEKYGCVECHTVLGNGGYGGGDITYELSVRDEAWVKRFLVGSPLIVGSNTERHPRMNAKDAENFIKYLQALTQINTHYWPPTPIRTRRASEEKQLD